MTIPAASKPGNHTVHAGSAKATFAVHTDWGQYRGDAARTGANPTENVITPATVGTLHASWSAALRPATGGVVAGGLVYYVAGTKLLALDAATGKQRWSVPVGQVFTPTVGVAGGRVLVGSRTVVQAFDAGTGAARWTWSSPHMQVFKPPAVTADAVYVSGDDAADVGRIWALDAATGALRWTSDPLEGFGSSAPGYADGRVYVGTIGKVHALDAATGANVWTTPIALTVDRTVTAVDGSVYVAVRGQHLYALAAATGAVRWQATPDTALETDVALAGGILAVAGTQPADGAYVHRLYGFDPATGQPRWTVTRQDGNPSGFGPVVIAGGLLYAGTEDLTAFDPATGAARWTRPNTRATVVVDGRLYTYDSGTGRVNTFTP